MGLRPLLLPQAFVLGSQELDAGWGPFPQGLRPGAVSHEARPQLPEVGRAQAGVGQPLHLDPGEMQTLGGAGAGEEWEVVGLKGVGREVRREGGKMQGKGGRRHWQGEAK